MPCIYSCILSSFQVVVIRLVRAVNAVYLFMYSIFFSGSRHSVSTSSECRVSIHVFLSSFQVVVIRLVRAVNAVYLFMYSIFFSGSRHSVSTSSECRVSIHVFYLLFR